jgi:hypothetical protein
MVSGDKVAQNGTKTEIKSFKNCALGVIYVYINLGFYNVYTMDRLVILFVTLALLLNNISYPSEAKGGVNKPSTISNTPDRFTTISLKPAFYRCWAGKSKRLKALSCRCR